MKNINKVPLATHLPAIPCGLVAKSVFNDTYELWKVGSEGNPDLQVYINSKNIAWTSDIS